MTDADPPEQALLAFVAEAAPPAQARERAVNAVVDLAVCALAAADTAVGQQLLRACEDSTTSPEFALAALGHALDCDDNHDTIGGHPSCVLVPALLHGASSAAPTMGEIADAYVVGVETMAAVARCIGRLPYERGWHTTCVYGVLGVAAALARLHGSTREVTLAAIGLAAAMASGTKAAFGSSAKPLQVGHAAFAGVLAHRLAAAGCSSSPVPLSGPQGLAAVLDPGPIRWAELNRLSTQWETLEPGLVFKRFPCCASTHAPVEGALALREAVPTPTRIEVRINPGRLAHVDRAAPLTGSDARFSLQYTVAAAWADGRCAADQFSDERLADPRIRSLMSMVAVRGDADLPWPAAVVGCASPDGWQHVTIEAAVGHTTRTPLTTAALNAKADSLGVDTSEVAELLDLAADPRTPAGQFAKILDARIHQRAYPSSASANIYSDLRDMADAERRAFRSEGGHP